MDPANTPPLSRRQIFGWCLFDFAATVLMANGGLYFAAWLVAENRTPDLAFNLTLAASTLAILAGGPLWGMLADRTRRHRSLLVLASLFMVGGTLALAVIDRSPALTTDLRTAAGLGSLFVVITAFQFATIAYNGLFVRAFPPEAHRRISGLGGMASWLGAILGLLFVLPFVNGWVPGVEGGRGSAFIPAGLAFAVLAVVSLVLMPTGRETARPPDTEDIRSLIGQTRGRPELVWFLLAYVLLMDAILTVQNNLPIFLTSVLQASPNDQAGLFITLFVCAAAGAAGSIWLLKRISAPRALPLIALGWTVLILAIAFTPRFDWLYVEFGLAGLLLGVTGNAWRIQFAAMIPAVSATAYFGVYNAFERLASILGPLVWGLLVYALASSAPDIRYRTALLAMAGFSILAFVALGRFAKVSRRGRGQAGGRRSRPAGFPLPRPPAGPNGPSDR